MGIKYVWNILTPFCERKPLYKLQGKTVAVDLSCWICEAQNVAEYGIQPRMYLRNLYFRTCYLLLMDITPIFVLEGKAPELKYNTISARNAIQFKGAKPKTDKVKTGKDRTRFHHILRSCEEMLNYMGLACVKGKGEAESMCAYLNSEGLVDGCISQDSDCFAYGAKVVYRNFSISTQGAYAASGGAIDIYDIRKAYESLIVMALLCGCDYNEGVHGIGKESVLKFFEKISDEDIFNRIKMWKTKPNLYEEYESRISDKDICKSCGHNGKIQAHSKNGCGPCGTTKGCDPFKFKEERLRIKNELNIRNKALQDPNFPDENLINEYLVKKDNVSELNLKWKQPDIVLFVKFTLKYLQWEEIYSFEKILPILTRWQCLNYNLLKTNVKGIIYPKQIKKVRNPKGIPSFEIIWSDPHEYFKGLIPDSQIIESKIDLDKLWSTIEPQVLVEKAYPELVEAFRQSKIKPPKTSKRKKKHAESENISITVVPVVKKVKKTKTVKNNNNEDKALQNLESSFKQLEVEKSKKKTATLDNFLKKAIVNNQKQNLSKKQIHEEENRINFDRNILQTSTPSKTVQNLSVNMNWSSFYDDNDDNDSADLSDIIEGIISRRPVFIADNLQKINRNVREDFNISANNENNSSFFVNKAIEIDLFEKTFNEIIQVHTDESEEEYGLDEIDNNLGNHDDNVQDIKNDLCEKQFNEDNEMFVKQKCSGKEMFDSFLGIDIDVPLIERLKKKM